MRQLSRCALVILSGPERGRERVIEGDVFRIGKSKDNELVLPDETVSRSHCEIVRDRRGYVLRDLGSTNGTLLDGAEIKEAWLKPGAVITVGKVELKVRPFAERIEIVPSERERYGTMVGRSAEMRRLFGLLESVGKADTPILIQGEPGTGKTLLARCVHEARGKGPFSIVDCSASVGAQLDVEIFGAFERADGGTIVLDAIDDLPLELAPKLLRVLEGRALRRSGRTPNARLDVRVLAASSRNLRLEVERGKFHEDLLFRIGAVVVDLPPLRDRREDIPLLIESLLGSSRSLDRAALDSLMAHDWPGNVRELRDVLNLALPSSEPAPRSQVAIDAPSPPDSMPSFERGKSYRASKSEWEAFFEREYVAALLAHCGGNISAAARAADMDRKYLHKLIRRHGLHENKR